MKIKFMDTGHKEFFLSMQNKAQIWDCYHKALFMSLESVLTAGKIFPSCLISRRTALKKKVCMAGGIPVAVWQYAVWLLTCGMIIRGMMQTILR